MTQKTAPTLPRRIATTLFLAFIFGLAFWVLSPFLASLAWAGILAYVSWPLYAWLQGHVSLRENLAALLMTLMMTMLLLVPMVWLMFVLADDVAAASAGLQQIATRGLPPLSPAVSGWPGGEWIVKRYQGIQADPAWVRARIHELGLTDASSLKALVGGVWRNVVKFGLAVFTLFFLYRHGDNVLVQFRSVATRWLGEAARDYIRAVGVTVRAVVFGIVLTALAQGLLAALGYWAAGVKTPVLWGVVTALLSIIPFAGPVVWIGLSLGLFAEGNTMAALGLFLWGALVVSSVDNLVRVIVISGPTRIPFLLVFFGVLGGVSAFGLIGLFLGPVILAVSLAIWREWLDLQSGQPPP